jgi:hypothetical protein
MDWLLEEFGKDFLEMQMDFSYGQLKTGVVVFVILTLILFLFESKWNLLWTFTWINY